MIQAHYIEIRSRRGPGETEPTTIIREVRSQNGKGRKTVRVLRGSRVLSDVSESLHPSENSNIQSRTFSPGLYASAEAKTMRKLNPRKATRRLNKRVRK
jgi:hypothetical protein